MWLLQIQAPRQQTPVEVCALGALAVVLFQPVDVLTEAHTQFDSRPGNLK